ncbi:MAG: ABC transporter substrate-binding protein [Armatimonadota bacterium]
MKRSLAGLVVLGVMALTFGAADQALSLAPGRVLVAAIAKMDIRTLDPHRQYEISPPQIMRAVYETLVTLGDQGRSLTKLEPLLAQSYSVSSDSKVYTFTLRKGVRFQTGGVMTADDVVFSYRRLGNLKDNPAWLFSDHVASIEAVDADTVRITLKEPNAAFLPILTSPNFAVVDAKAVRAHNGTDAANADKADKATDWLDQNSAGTGPFVLKKWTRGVEVALERNGNYWRQPSPWSRIVVRDIPDPATQLELVERGDVQIAESLDADLTARFRRSGKGRVVEGSTLDMTYLAMTTNVSISSALAERKVRQAIAHAIDFDGIVKGLMRGSALQIPSIIPLGLLGTDPALAPRRDLSAAKRLLRDAGYPNGFSVKMIYPTRVLVGGLSAETLATKLQADLAQIGVQLQLEPRETVAWRADYRNGRLAITIADWTPDFADPHGWAIPFAVKGSAAARRVYYDNARAGALATTAGRLTDAGRRARMYIDLQRLLIGDAAFVGLIQPKVNIAVSPNIRGVTYNPVYFLDYYYVR